MRGVRSTFEASMSRQCSMEHVALQTCENEIGRDRWASYTLFAIAFRTDGVNGVAEQ